MRRLALAVAGTLGLAAPLLAQDAAADPAAGPDDARRDAVYARFDDFAVTVGDVEDAIAAFPPSVRERFRDPEEVRLFARSLVEFELLAREGIRRGLDRDPEIRAVARRAAVQQLLRRDFDDRFTADSVSTEDARAYFEAHRDEFGRPELRRASHILLATREEAVKLLAEARAMDTNGFRATARGNSLDAATKQRGGDLRFFAEDGTLPRSKDPAVEEALARAAFALEAVGDVYPEPIPVGDRFSLLMLTGRRAPETRTFEQLEGNLKLRIARDRREAAVDALIRELRQKTPPETVPDALAFELTLPEPPAPGRAVPPPSPTTPFVPGDEAPAAPPTTAPTDG